MSKHKSINERSLINQKICEARKLKKLNQYQAAEKMGMLYDTYSKKERNGKITVDWLLEFCDAIQISPSFFADIFAEEPKPLKDFKFGTEPTVEDILFGKTTPKNPKPVVESKTQKIFDFEPTATEISVLKTYHGLSKSKQKEARDFIDSINKRAK